MTRYGNNLGRCIGGVNYPYLLRSPAGGVAAKDGAGDDLPLTLGGGPRSGCTANETIAAGEVGVIEPGTTTISKVKISATSYTFAEIQQTIIDTYGESNASTWMDIFRVDAFRFFVVFNGREDGMYYPTPRCCVVSATPAGFVVGDVFEAGFASGSARYYSAGQFSAGRFLLYERSQEQAIIATVTGAAVTFTSVFSLDIGGDAYYPAFEAARDGVLLAMTQDVSTNEAVLSLIRDDGDNAMTLTSITVTGYQPSGQPCLTRVRSGVFLSRIQSGGGASAPWFVAVSVVGDVIGYGTPVDSGSAVLAGEITFTVLDETRVFAAWGYTTDLAGCVLTVGGLTVTPGGIVVLEDFLPGASSRGMSSVLLDDEHVGIATYAYNTTSAYVTVANIVAATGVQWTNPVDTLTVPAKAAVTSCRMLHALGAGTGLWATCGNVILLRFAYTGIEVSNIDGAIVVIDQGGNVGDPLTFWPLGEVAESFTGLVPGMDYYLDEDGSMSMVKTPTSRYIGTALTADDMLTVPMILNKFQPHAQGTDETLAVGTINEISAGRIVAAVELLENCQESLDELLLHQQDGTVTSGACDMSTGRVFAISGASAVTVSFTNIPAGVNSWALLNITDANGNVTLPTPIAWPDGVAPILSLVGLDKVLVAFDSSANMSGNFDLDVKAAP